MGKNEGLKLALHATWFFMLLLFFAFAGLTIALGAVGIVEAGKENRCGSVNDSVECRLDVVLDTSENVTSNSTAGFRPVLLEPKNDWLRWMGGCTAAGFLSAVMTTVSTWVVIEIIRKFQVLQEEEEKEDKERGRGRPRTESTTPLAVAGEDHTAAASALQEGKEETDSDGLTVMIDRVGEYELQEWRHKPLRHFTPPSLAALFLSNLCFVGALLCLLWGIAVAFDHTRRVEVSVTAFIATEVLVGVGVPVLLFTSGALLAVVLDFITIGHLDGRRAIPRFLPGVQFVKGHMSNYWVIENIFYFPLPKKKHHLEHDCCYACDKSRATWYLSTMLGLAITLAVSYFIDRAVVDIRTVGSCDSASIDDNYDCFNATSFDHVDCQDPFESMFAGPQIHCFRFLRLGEDVSIIATLAESFAFYLFVVAFFTKIFGVVKVLLHLKPSRFWGIWFLGIGIILFVVAVILLALSDRLVIQIDVIGALQFIMVSIYFVIVGMLLVEGQWWERVPSHKIVRDLPLVHYSDTTRGRIHEVEHRLATEGDEAALEEGHHKPTTTVI